VTRMIRLLPLWLTLAAPAVAQTPPVTQDPARPLLADTQALFDSYVREGRMPGIVGAFGRGDSATLFVTAGRIADTPAAPAAGPDTLWRIYSMTKPITGMAVMKLVEEGRIGLDDPVAKYIPAFAKMRVLTHPDTSLESVPARQAITIRHLLTHTSGLGYSINAHGPLLREYERLGLVPLAINATAEAKMRATRPATLAEFADRVATVPLVAEPGTRWRYSIGFDVLGRVIEVASGMPFDRFLQTRFFTPLKMDSTVFTVPAGDAGRLATNYAVIGATLAPLDPGRTSVFLTPPSFPYGGAGLVSSARDYDRFLHMLQNGGTLDGVRVMKAETVRLALSNLLPAGVVFGGAGMVTGDRPGAAQGFGAGGSVRLADEAGGPGKGTFGWAGAAGSIGWVDPTRGIRGTVMVNIMGGDVPLAEQVGAALLRDAKRLHGE